MLFSQSYLPSASRRDGGIAGDVGLIAVVAVTDAGTSVSGSLAP